MMVIERKVIIVLCWFLLYVWLDFDSSWFVDNDDESRIDLSGYNLRRGLEEDGITQDAEIEQPNQEENLQHLTNVKPVMHTFFDPVPNSCCGMNEEGHETLLDVWKKAWEAEGWQTKVLTKNDAKSHPDFKSLNARLEKLHVTPYNRRCFWRWLAMASLHDEDGEEAGGGWMSDYDLFPVGLTSERGVDMSKDGTFKSYSLHVPCLIHASSEEWDRIIHLMIDVIPETMEPDKKVTDMFMLQDVDKKLGRSQMIWTKDVFEPKFLYSADENGVLAYDCNDLNSTLAIHLSHHTVYDAFENNLFPKSIEGVNSVEDAAWNRAELAALLTDRKKVDCIVQEK